MLIRQQEQNSESRKSRSTAIINDHLREISFCPNYCSSFGNADGISTYCNNRAALGHKFVPSLIYPVEFIPIPTRSRNKTHPITAGTYVKSVSPVLLCSLTALASPVLTRSSADADNGLDAFSGQSRSTNMVPFWVHCDFSLSM